MSGLSLFFTWCCSSDPRYLQSCGVGDFILEKDGCDLGYRKGDLFFFYLENSTPSSGSGLWGPNTLVSTKYFAEKERFLSGKISSFIAWFHYPLIWDLE